MSFTGNAPRATTISRGNNHLVWIAAIAALLLVIPVCADSGMGTRYMSGNPELSAHVSGTNEFMPGDAVDLPIVIENSGLNQFKIVQSGIVDPGDLSNTAKQLKVTLGSGDSPILIKSDPQLVGDLTGSSSTTATFRIQVNQDAPAGTYYLPVDFNYTYLYRADQIGTETLEYTYKTINKTISIPIRIKPAVQLTVLSVTPQDLNANNEGYVTLTVKNTGYENGTNAVMLIQRNGVSPVSPTESSVYIGDYPIGAVANCTFRVAISSDAQQKTYPLDVYVNYKNRDGDYLDTTIDTVGVAVGQKVAFNVTPVQTKMTAGGKTVISVKFQNIGGATAYNAQARISAVDPFTSNDDTAYLGTMAPGDIREASYEISADAGATAKEYGLDSEVIYRDALNNQVTTDPIKVTVEVVPSKGLVDVLGLPGLLVLAVIAILAILGYVLYTRRARQQ